jgi:hypothetical protein
MLTRKKVKNMPRKMQLSFIKTNIYKIKSQSIYGKKIPYVRKDISIISNENVYTHDIIEYKIENVIRENEIRNPVNSINLYEKNNSIISNNRYENIGNINSVNYFENILKTLSNINLLLENKGLNDSNTPPSDNNQTLQINETNRKHEDNKWDDISKLIIKNECIVQEEALRRTFDSKLEQDCGEEEGEEEEEEESIDNNLKDLLMNYNKELLKIRKVEDKIIPDDLSENSI